MSPCIANENREKSELRSEGMAGFNCISAWFSGGKLLIGMDIVNSAKKELVLFLRSRN
jgi:hypothetical protein